MDKNKTILLDIDDTVLDWSEGFKMFAERKLNKKLLGRQTNYDMEKWLGIDKKEIIKMVKDFNDNSTEFSLLKPIAKSEIYLPLIKKKGYELIAITSCSDKETSIIRRKQNIINVFGDIFSNVHCISLSSSKKGHLQNYEPTLWIEDKVENAQLGLELGFKSIIIEQPHNINQKDKNPQIIWVKDWTEIYSMIQFVK
jgi:uncharacterized HAD superfamily protein